MRLASHQTAGVRGLNACAWLPSCLRRLISINPDNHRHHFGLLRALRLAPASAGGAAGGPAAAAAAAAGPAAAAAAMAAPDFSGLSEEQRGQLAAVYAELAAAHPHSAACRRLPLDFLQGQVGAGSASRKFPLLLRQTKEQMLWPGCACRHAVLRSAAGRQRRGARSGP